MSTQLSKLMAVLFAALLASGASILSAQTLDIVQPRVDEHFQNVRFWSAQTFTPQANVNVGAGFYLLAPLYFTAPMSGAVNIHLWDGNPSLNSTLLRSGVAQYTLNLGMFGLFSSGWADADWAPVELNAGVSYWLTIGGGESPTTPSVAAATGDPYFGGNAFMADPVALETSRYVAYGRDLTFRTLSTTVPEPSTGFLMVIGLVGVGLGVRIRRSFMSP